MIEQVRVGVVGTSWWADRMHLPALKSHASVCIAAICGRNQQRAGEMAQKYGIPQIFDQYQYMISHANLDAVIIAVPDDMHFPIAMAALDAGLHVLCEKPMAFTLDQARQMLARAEDRRLKHMVMYTWRWAACFRTLVKLVNEGYIGQCYDAHFHYVGGYARGAAYQWKWDRQHGLGVLGDLGSHMLDLARLVVGDISSVQANLSIHVSKAHPHGLAYEAANDSATVSVRFANGATGAMITTAAAALGNRGQEQRVTLYGTEGSLEVSATMSGYSVRGLRSGDTEFQEIPIPDEYLHGTQRNAPHYEQLARIFIEQAIGPRLFIDGILENRLVKPGFYEGMKVQEIIEAALESELHQNGISGCTPLSNALF